LAGEGVTHVDLAPGQADAAATRDRDRCLPAFIGLTERMSVGLAADVYVLLEKKFMKRPTNRTSRQLHVQENCSDGIGHEHRGRINRDERSNGIQLHAAEWPENQIESSG
jgi:hypothetical protein